MDGILLMSSQKNEENNCFVFDTPDEKAMGWLVTDRLREVAYLGNETRCGMFSLHQNETKNICAKRKIL